MTTSEMVYAHVWQEEHPYSLTAVSLAADRLEEAEVLAWDAVGGLVLPKSWAELHPQARRCLVRACRRIPIEGLWHVQDDRTQVSEERSRRDCFAQLKDDWPHASPLTGRDAGPGMGALTRLSALVCRMSPGLLLDADEDLLDIYDTYTVGGLAGTTP
ncbi:hypothetical protein [Streptomyces sp. NPDC005907]|uniref:hypothetical protein n=1 Tax=Streptomyces sp. NPDC005907 TaxID=3154571 RepID=UPI0033D720A3